MATTVKSLRKRITLSGVLQALCIISVVIPILRPLGIPVPVSVQERTFYNTIEGLNRGDTVIVDFDLEPARYEAAGYGCAVVVKRLWEKGVRFVIYTFGEAGTSAFPRFIAEPLLSLKDYPNIKYGRDMIYAGFIAGSESGMSLVSRDLWSKKQDFYGNNFDDLPLAKEIKKFEDFKLVLFFNSSTVIGNSVVRQWLSTFKTPAIGLYPAAEAGSAMVWYPQTIRAVVSDVLGSAGLETLFKTPYRATAIVDAMSSTSLLLFLVIVATNLVYWSGKGRRVR